jgi:hypothetical protein
MMFFFVLLLEVRKDYRVEHPMWLVGDTSSFWVVDSMMNVNRLFGKLGYLVEKLTTKLPQDYEPSLPHGETTKIAGELSKEAKYVAIHGTDDEQ